MFDLSSSKLLVLAIVALIVVGPKDLPVLLRTIGRYLGMIKRQAGEFRTQFEDAMRDSELADLKKEVEQLGNDAKQTFDDAGRSLDTHVNELSRTLDNTASDLDKAVQSKPAGEASPAIATDDTPAALTHEPTPSSDASQTAPADVELPKAEVPDPGAIEPPPELVNKTPPPEPTQATVAPAAPEPPAPAPARPRTAHADTTPAPERTGA